MPPTKKILGSGNKSVQAISTHLLTLANELDELRAKPTEESLEQRAQELDESVQALVEFKLILEILCGRFKKDTDDLFGDHLWESILYRCSRYSATYNTAQPKAPPP